MGKKKVGHASWFKLYLNHAPVLNEASDECAGRAIKAALRYLETGQLPDGLDMTSRIIFASLRPSVDEAIEDYKRKSTGGKAGNERRWGKAVSDGIALRYPATPSDRIVSDGIEKTEERRQKIEDVGFSSAPGLEAGEQNEELAEKQAKDWRDKEGIL